MYRRLNKLYFDSELPDIEIVWEPQPGDGANGMTHTYNAEAHRLCIDPSLRGNNKFIKIIMCHEMCHVKNPKSRHGKGKFDEEIQRLCTFASYRKLL